MCRNTADADTDTADSTGAVETQPTHSRQGAVEAHMHTADIHTQTQQTGAVEGHIHTHTWL